MYRAVVGGVMLLALLTPLVAKSRVIKITPPTKQFRAIAMVVDDWAGYSLLKHMASCESWGDANKTPREFLPDGSVLRGYPDPDDVGLGQINIPTWGAKAKELGFNLFTYAGNLKMMKWIFDNDPRHEANWNPSKGCWGKYQ